jgi:predicted GH43/DUF377 family glycosyl hydrolase
MRARSQTGRKTDRAEWNRFPFFTVFTIPLSPYYRQESSILHLEVRKMRIRVVGVAAVVVASLCVAGVCSRRGSAAFEPAVRVATRSPAAEWPAEWTRWKPARTEPVFQGAGPGHWDAAIRERGWILRESDGWRLWYTGYDGTRSGIRRLGYATSPDGYTWTRHAGNPLLADLWVEDMQVISVGGTYYMFAEGLNDQAQLLTSPDRVTWTPRGTLDIRYTNGQPLTPGPFGTPTAIHHDDGTWTLLYERGDKGVWIAKSSDLKVWTHVTDDPVLVPGPEAYDREMIAVNQVLRRGDEWFATYHGTGSTSPPRTWCSGLIRSRDLKSWTKFTGNPIVPLEQNLSSGILVDDGTAWRLYTMHDAVRVWTTELQ